MRPSLLIFLVVFVAFAWGCKDSLGTEIKVVTPEEMQSLMEQEDVQLVDVRNARERKDGFIEHSQNIDFSSPTFDEDLKKLDKTKPVILYCRAEGLSATCADKLIAAGFVKVHDLDDGLTQWRFMGYGVELNN